MAHARSRRVQAVKEKLLTRIRSGYYRPGERFFSNRGLARHFEISYQTAHRLMKELEAEGWLERREHSGSYIAGPIDRPSAVTLCFGSRARRAQSFGERVLSLLCRELDRLGIPRELHWDEDGEDSAARVGDCAGLPIIWESPGVVRRLSESRRFAVLINERPPAGFPKSHIDSVSVDDESGGVSAANLILRHVPRGREVAILQGPPTDRRNAERVAGFRSVIPRATLFSAESWEFADGYRSAVQVVAHEPTAVFCTNDRLASALLQYCRDVARTPPGVVGFDNAPVAEALDITTIAIPWEQMAQTIAQIAQRRLAGDTETSIQYILNTIPVVRDKAFALRRGGSVPGMPAIE